MLPADSVQLRDHCRGRQAPPVDGSDVAALVLELDDSAAASGAASGDRVQSHNSLGRLGPGVFELVALVGDVQQVGVGGVRRFVARAARDGNAVFLRIDHEALARVQVPFPPRRDHADVRVEGVGAELESDLVVAFSGGPVSDRVGAALRRDLHQTLGDEGPGDGSAEQILALVDRVGPEHGKHEVAGELLPQILDVDRGGPERLRLGASGLELLALSEVCGERDDLAAIVVLQPLENDGGVEPARVGEHYLGDVAHDGWDRRSDARGDPAGS